MNAGPTGTVGELGPDRFEHALRGHGLGLRIGPFDGLLQVRVSGLYEPLYRLYQDFPLVEAGPRVFHFHVALRDRRRLFPRPARLVRFTVDGRAPHEDMPAAQALPVLEWGINLVIALRYHRFLMLHSAVVERNGRVLLMPAAPGHGKTTLCAALVHRGWRLFSDEFGLVRPGSTQFLPVPRPMPLKNESIRVIRAFAPEAELGPEIPKTRKGTIAHVRPPPASLAQGAGHARAAWLVFPRWVQGAAMSLQGMHKAEAFMLLATNAFNYEVLGAQAFDTVRQIVDASHCLRLEYSRLDEAVAALTSMADGDAP